MKCENCGIELPENVTACPECGAVNESLADTPAPDGRNRVYGGTLTDCPAKTAHRLPGTQIRAKRRGCHKRQAR